MKKCKRPFFIKNITAIKCAFYFSKNPVACRFTEVFNDKTRPKLHHWMTYLKNIPFVLSIHVKHLREN